MKRFVILVIFILSFAALYGQNFVKVADNEKSAVVEAINSHAASVKSIKSEFVQTKRLMLLNEDMVSYGSMYYYNGTKLRWEYTKPYKYIFILADNTVMLKNDSRTDLIDVKTNKLFSQIASVMMGSITGSSLKESRDFQMELYESEKAYRVNLKPLKREVKQMFSMINLFFNKESYFVQQIELVEQGGDKTTIVLKNIELNGVPDESIFDTGN